MPYVILLLGLLTQDQPSFRSDVALVRVDAEVRTQTSAVNDLQQESFRVTDGGRPQKVLYFAHDEQPLDMILLLDASSSMRPVVARVAEAAHMALGELREGDRVSVMAFDNKTVAITDFTGDFNAAEKSIGEQVLKNGFGGGTRIQDALADAAGQFLTQPPDSRRRTIVIVTDDDGTGEQPAALRALWKADAVVLGVIVRKPRSGPVYVANYVYMGMRNIAVKTGGDSIDTGDAAEAVSYTHLTLPTNREV